MKISTQPIRFLHIMLRVKDLKKSIYFYTTFFGLKVLRQVDYPEGRFTISFLGFHSELAETVIELTHNWDEQRYEKGSAFGHLAFGIEDINEICQFLRGENINITREPGPMKFDDKELIAFIEDPDGYGIELIQFEKKI